MNEGPVVSPEARLVNDVTARGAGVGCPSVHLDVSGDDSGKERSRVHRADVGADGHARSEEEDLRDEVWSSADPSPESCAAKIPVSPMAWTSVCRMITPLTIAKLPDDLDAIDPSWKHLVDRPVVDLGRAGCDTVRVHPGREAERPQFPGNGGAQILLRRR